MLLRPTLFLPVWIFFLLGAHFGGGNFSFRAIIIFILYTMLMGGIYIFNQIIDRESDKRNEKLFLLSLELIPIRFAVLEMIGLFIFSIFGALFLNFEIFMVFLISFILGITYSLPPFETKGKPFLDILWNSLGYGVLAFTVGWLSVRDFSQKMLISSIPYFFAVAGVFVNTTIPDIEGDKREGKITTGVFLGKKRTLLLGIFFDLIAIFFSIALKDFICLIGASLAFPIFLFAYIRSTKKSILFSFRVVPFILTLEVFFLTPWIIPLFVFILGIEKIYYKKRFNLNYPALFSGEDRNF